MIQCERKRIARLSVQCDARLREPDAFCRAGSVPEHCASTLAESEAVRIRSERPHPSTRYHKSSRVCSFHCRDGFSSYKPHRWVPEFLFNHTASFSTKGLKNVDASRCDCFGELLWFGKVWASHQASEGKPFLVRVLHRKTLPGAPSATLVSSLTCPRCRQRQVYWIRFGGSSAEGRKKTVQWNHSPKAGVMCPTQ